MIEQRWDLKALSTLVLVAPTEREPVNSWTSAAMSHANGLVQIEQKIPSIPPNEIEFCHFRAARC